MLTIIACHHIDGYLFIDHVGCTITSSFVLDFWLIADPKRDMLVVWWVYWNNSECRCNYKCV